MVLVFDVGGTHTRLGLGRDGKLVRVSHFDTPKVLYGDRAFEQQLKDFCGNSELEAIVGDVPGDLDPAGQILASPNLPEWVGVNLKQDLQQMYECPIHILNDVMLCGLGEVYNGSGLLNKNVAYVTVSTGVNAVIIRRGKFDANLTTYNLGRQIVSGGPRQSTALEDLIGGAAIERRTGQPPSAIHQRVFWQQSAMYLARAVYNIRLFWDPDVVVFGGTMMKDIRLEDVEEELTRLPAVFHRPLELRSAALAGDAGLYGGLAYLENF